MKKLISLLVVAAFALTLVPVAKADQISDLMALIASLQAQIAALQGTATTGTTCFATNLKLGMTSADVKLLQTKLGVINTGYFGPLTLAAVKTFQAANGVPATGFVGELTRAQLNAKFCTATTTPTTATTVAGAVEGTFTVKLATQPVSNLSGINAAAGIPVYGVDVTAKYSDVTIDRLDLQTKVEVGSSSYNPSTLITKIGIYDGSTLLMEKSIAASDFVKDSANVWYIRLAGINFKVAKDVTKTLTVKVDTIGTFDTDRTLTINVYGTQGIRGTDGVGLSTYAALATTRAFVIRKAGNATLAATNNVNTPKASNVFVDINSGVNDVDLMHFDVKATKGDAKITSLAIVPSDATVTAAPSSYKLYDGSTLVSSILGTATTFTDLTIAVSKDTTKTLSVKADFAAATTTGNLIVTLAANGISYEATDGSTATVGATSVTGNTVTLDNYIPTFTFVSGINTITNPTTGSSYATGVITFKAKANGGALTKLTTASSVIGANTIKIVADFGGTTKAVDSAIVTATPDANTPDGSETTYVVSASVASSVAKGFVKFYIDSIEASIAGGTANTVHSGIFSDYKTNDANLQ